MKVFQHQGGARYLRHHYCTLKPRGVLGRNTENSEIGNDVEVAEYQGRRYVVLGFVYDEKHVIFNPIGKGRRKKEIKKGIKVIISLVL